MAMLFSQLVFYYCPKFWPRPVSMRRFIFKKNLHLSRLFHSVWFCGCLLFYSVLDVLKKCMYTKDFILFDAIDCILKLDEKTSICRNSFWTYSKRCFSVCTFFQNLCALDDENPYCNMDNTRSAVEIRLWNLKHSKIGNILVHNPKFFLLLTIGGGGNCSYECNAVWNAGINVYREEWYSEIYLS